MGMAVTILSALSVRFVPSLVVMVRPSLSIFSNVASEMISTPFSSSQMSRKGLTRVSSEAFADLVGRAGVDDGDLAAPLDQELGGLATVQPCRRQ